MPTVKILSAGAAEALLRSYAGLMPEQEEIELAMRFEPVGAAQAALEAGAAADLVILTAEQITQLGRRGILAAETRRDVGRVHLAAAVPIRPGLPKSLPAAEDLAGLLEAASAIYLPDPERSTAGRQAVQIAEALGLRETVSGRLRVFARGAEALAALAAADEARPLGFAQSTEILATQGVQAIRLPPGCDPSTLYTAAATPGSAQRPEVMRVLSALTGPGRLAERQRAGFATA